MKKKNPLGLKIKHSRLAKSLTQKELAHKLDVEDYYISRWESGVKPSAKYLAKLADALDVDISELYSAGQSTNIFEQTLEDKKSDLAQLVTRCVEQALANDPRLRLMDTRLEEIVKRLEKTNKG